MVISLEEGEALCIRGNVVLRASAAAGNRPRWEIVVTHERSWLRNAKRGYARRLGRALVACWLRMHRLGAAAGRRSVQARLEYAQLRALAALDPRTLKDIGLEPYLADRVEALQREERIRALTARLGSLM